MTNIPNPGMAMLLAAISINLLGGCATADSPGSNAAALPIAALNPESAGYSLAHTKASPYLRVRTEILGIVNVADDGRNTYAALASVPPPDDLVAYDRDGKLLRMAVVGNILAIQGTHPGILFRAGGYNAYVTPNPEAGAETKFNVLLDPDVVFARTRLEQEVVVVPAMDGAIARADAAGGRPALASGSVASAPGQAPFMLPTRTPSSSLEPSTGKTVQRLPNGDSKVTIYFASGGRTVVAPDDGLAVLEREAKGAKEVQVTGYTDSVGEARLNEMLAQARAISIRDFLVFRGVEANKIVLVPPSASSGRYIASNAVPQGRALNRRVEVVFVRPAGAGV